MEICKITVRIDSKYRAVTVAGIQIYVPAKACRAVEITVHALDKPGTRIGTICRVLERVQVGLDTEGTYPKHRTRVCGTAVEGGAVKIAIAALDKPCVWSGAITATK